MLPITAVRRPRAPPRSGSLDLALLLIVKMLACSSGNRERITKKGVNREESQLKIKLKYLMLR
jgi:hypothetical protein